MIKQIEFATRRSDVKPVEFAEAWYEFGSLGAQAPADAQPRRIAVCLTLPGEADAPKHDGVTLRWFDDRLHLERFEEWCRAASLLHTGLGPEVIDTAASPVVIAEEVVLRGDAWLEHRWADGGEKLKHMAIARRAAGLSPAEFSYRWRGKAGTVQKAGDRTATVIPDNARGLAYVQNHPLPRQVGDWAYDAINEVYFDDIESLRTRENWFAANVGAAAEKDLIGENWFLSVREEVLPRERRTVH